MGLPNVDRMPAKAAPGIVVKSFRKSSEN